MKSNIIIGCFMMGTALAGSIIMSIIYFQNGSLWISGFFASLLLVPSLIDIITTLRKYNPKEDYAK